MPKVREDVLRVRSHLAGEEHSLRSGSAAAIFWVRPRKSSGDEMTGHSHVPTFPQDLSSLSDLGTLWPPGELSQPVCLRPSSI